MYYKNIAKSGWHEIGGKKHFFRSKLEVKQARLLQFQKEQKLIKDWFYEPKTFWFEKIKRGVVSYKPDFLVEENNGNHYWIECKGYLDQRSKTKIKRFNKYYESEKLIVVSK